MATVNLSVLFPDTRYQTTSSGLSNTYATFNVYNTNLNSVCNGGQCCLWTVPAGVCWAKFEVWGGGGSGGGACCCQQPCYPGGSGSYARRTIPVTPGNQFTICAGGNGSCQGPCCGQSGYDSFVQNSGSVQTAINLCASGGYWGATGCFFGFGSCCSCASCQCGAFCGADFGICGGRGGTRLSNCGYDAYAYVPGPTYIGAGVQITMDFCQGLSGNQMMTSFNCGSAYAVFPGGGMSGASTQGGVCCCGGMGAGGLVTVTYR